MVFATELRDSAYTYAYLIEPPPKDSCSTTLHQLNEIGVVQHLPFLMAAKERLDSKGFETAVNLVEAIYVRYLLIGDQNPNELEHKYSMWAKAIRNGEPISAIRTEAVTLLLRCAEIKEGFVGLNLAKTAQARFIFRRINEKRYGPKELDWSRVSLEHILPQNPAAAWLTSSGVTKVALPDHLNRIGNLTLLDRGLNTSASNNSFEDKKAVYKKSEFQLTRELLDLSGWTVKAIDTREDDLGTLAKAIWEV